MFISKLSTYHLPRNKGFLGQHSPTHLFLKGEHTKLWSYFQTPDALVIHGNPNPSSDDINIFLCKNLGQKWPHKTIWWCFLEASSGCNAIFCSPFYIRHQPPTRALILPDWWNKSLSRCKEKYLPARRRKQRPDMFFFSSSTSCWIGVVFLCRMIFGMNCQRFLYYLWRT